MTEVREKKLILGLGHPRTGTGHTSRLLKSWGLRVGHEYMDNHGIVAFQFVTEALPPMVAINKYPDIHREMWEFETIIYNLRNPLKSLPSIIFSENYSLEWRGKWGNFEIKENILTTGIESLLSWDKMIMSKKPDIIFRIENQEKFLFEKIQELYPQLVRWSEVEVGKLHNRRNHEGWENLQKYISDVPRLLLEELNDYSERNGYQKIFNTVTYELENSGSLSFS